MNWLHELFWAGVIPLTAAAAAAFALRWLRAPWRVVWSIAVGTGYVAGQWALAARPGIGWAYQAISAPREATDWLPHGVLLAMGISLLASFLPRRWRPASVGLSALLAFAAPARLLAGPLAQRWTLLEKLSYLALLGAGLSLVWLLIASSRDERQPRFRQLLSGLSAAGGAIVLALSGSFTLGRLAGVLAAAMAGTALVAPRGLAGAAGVVAIALGGLVILGVFYAGLSPLNAALVLLSMIAAAGPLPFALHSWPTWQQNLLRTALWLAPLAAALAASAG